MEASLFWRDISFAQYQATGQVPKPAGNTSVSIVPYGVFTTADGSVMLACAGDGMFASLATALDRKEWLQDSRFATNSARVANRDIVVTAIEETLQTRSRDYWVELLGNSRVPCAPILTVAEAHAHPQVQALGILQSAPGVDRPVVSAPWTIDGIRPPCAHRRPSTYGIRAFDSAWRAVAIVNPAVMVANCAHPALIVLGPGGL